MNPTPQKEKERKRPTKPTATSGSKATIVKQNPSTFISLWHLHVLLRRRLQAFGLPIGPSLRLLVPPRLHRRRRHMDRRIAAKLHMPMLPVRDGVSGAST